MSSDTFEKVGGDSKADHLDDDQIPPDGPATDPPRKRKRQRDKPTETPPNFKASADGAATLFACPFFKSNPVHYYRCLHFKIQRLGDLEQHILRKHVNSCPCGGELTSKGSMEELTQRGCCYISESTSKLIRSGKRNGKSQGDRWHSVWDIIFPKHPRPDSPYIYGDYRDAIEVARESSLRWPEKVPIPPPSSRTEPEFAEIEATQPIDWVDLETMWPEFQDDFDRHLEWPALSEAEDAAPLESIGLRSSGDVADTRSGKHSDEVHQVSGIEHAPAVLKPDSGYASSKTHTRITSKTGIEKSEDATREPDFLTRNQLEEEGDEMTVYSRIEDTAEAELDAYKSELSQAILRSIRHLNCQPRQIDHIASVLPTLLRSFALRLGLQGSNQAAKDAMYFVHKYRGDITARLQSAAKGPHDETSEDQPSFEPLSRQDIEAWRQEVRQCSILVSTEAPDEEPREEDDDSELSHESVGEFEEPPPLPDKPGYRDAVFKSTAFRWLLEALANSVMLSFQGENFCATLQAMVSKCLERHKSVSNKRASECYTMVFQADWNPTAFLTEQFPEDSDIGRLLGEVLTLTGSTTNAQILPCAEYMCQTWPSTGSALLELLKTAAVSGTTVSGVLEDGTRLEISFETLRLGVEVCGTAASISEVGEQIAWLGAALRSSCVESGIATCTPQIRMDDTDGRKSCHISFRMKPYRGTDRGLSNGQCWHELCQNPVLVEGYPIATRSHAALGLEIPLNVLSGLTQCPRVNKFFGHYYLKGFSTAVMATRNLGTEMLWHFYYSPDGSRLPYPTPDQETEEEETQIDLKALTHARHIVGWCSKAEFHAGAPDMNYNIKPTRLKRPSKDFSLEKLSVSVGSVVTAGCQFAIGEKDAHVRITRIRYGSKLSWIHRKYVTLWDVDEKRGWLVKGTAALLHLLRASLHFNRTDEVQCGFLLDKDQPKDSSHPLTLNSSLYVLQDESNLKLELFPPEDKTKSDGTPFKLKARVEELYDMLEMLIDHQASAEASYKGIDAKIRFRDHLEGWDFADIATDLPPFKLKQTTVPAQMRSWVDFTRSIPAITLFGRGFGDIIRATPAGTGNSRNPAALSCNEWETVPKNRHLLCVSAADLGKILARTGDDSTCPVTLGDGIIWHNPHDEGPFQTTCSCTSGQLSKRNHHPIQEVRSSLERFKMSKTTIDLEAHPSGAVIFGEKQSWLTALTTSSSNNSSQGTPLGHSSTSAQSDGGDASSGVLTGSSIQASASVSASGQRSDEQLAELAAMTVSQPDEEEDLAQGMSDKARGKRNASPLRGERGTKRKSLARMAGTWGKTLHGTGSRDKGSR